MRPCRRERSARGARERGARHAPPMCPQRRVLILVAGRRFFSGKRKREGMKINFLNQTKAQAPGSGDIVDRQDLTVAGCICEAWCFSDAVCAHEERHVPDHGTLPHGAVAARREKIFSHLCMVRIHPGFQATWGPRGAKQTAVNVTTPAQTSRPAPCGAPVPSFSHFSPFRLLRPSPFSPPARPSLSPGLTA